MENQVTKEEIKEMIVDVRGQKVILSSDLAKLFELETKYINRVARRNINKFDNTNYFQITKDEYSRCQFDTLNNQKNNRGTNLKYLPYVFSKEGVEILSHILKSEKAKIISKDILEVFECFVHQEAINKVPVIREEIITTKIYEIRGVQVMLDSDLAEIYECRNGTKDINRAVNRNVERFPEDFYFQLTKEEFVNLKFQFGTSSWNNYGGVRKLPHVFTEQGVAMLSAALKTDRAAKASISIIRAFILMRKYVSNNLLEQRYINNQVFKNAEDIRLLQLSFSKLEEKRKVNEIYFNGQIYDAYSKVLDLMKEAKNELVIIDGYADKSVLDMISKINVKVILVVKIKSLLSKLDIEKYNKQYSNLKVVYSDTYHDRYIILDNKKVYHLGASINHLGSKTFSINTISDESIIKLLVDNVSLIV